MNQLQAFKDTLQYAHDKGMHDCDFDVEGVDYWHIQDMLERIESNRQHFSEAKLGRWLGWAQGVIVANGYGTLEDMKDINKRNNGQDIDKSINEWLARVAEALHHTMLNFGGAVGKWYKFSVNVKIQDENTLIMSDELLSSIEPIKE